MLADEPDDVFLRYSLALELEKEDDFEQGLTLLRELMNESVPYVPAFFMAGQLLAKHGQTDEARTVLRDGIEQARQQGDGHAAGEMSEFLAGLG
jgi:thioredoxin-like negative regulator of GroEL